jgi:hypothetical protein
LRNRADVPEGSPKQPDGKEADSPPAADDQESSPKRPDGEETDHPLVADADLCVSCHHPVDGMTRHLTCATPDCHDNLNPKDKSVRSYYLAAHAAPKGRFYSCVACHTEQAGDDAQAMKRMAGCEESVCHHS